MCRAVGPGAVANSIVPPHFAAVDPFGGIVSSSATQVQPPATVNTVPLAKANSNLALLVTKEAKAGISDLRGN